MNTVKVKFADSSKNYTTSVAKEANEATARAYFVGQSFDFGGPEGPEDFQTCIDIDFNPAEAEARPVMDLELEAAKFDLPTYLETHFDVVEHLVTTSHFSGSMAHETMKEQGSRGLYQLAKSLTDQFEKTFKGTAWGTEEAGDYYDTITAWLEAKEIEHLKDSQKGGAVAL